MSDPLFWHRVQFGFTVTYHYLFPQLTMGLALLIVILKVGALRRLKSHPADTSWDDAARFWVRIFGLNFAMGVVTGVPMEFQFGTNWARFSAHAGGVIGQTLAMEGIFAFFLESSFLAALVWGERKLSRGWHLAAAVALFVGSWLSGYFIVTTNAFMQHPVGYETAPDGSLQVARLAEFLFNPWALAQYAHTMMAAVVTASFVMSAVGAFWLLRQEHSAPAAVSLRVGVVAGLVSALLVAAPTGHVQGQMVAAHQPVALAAMEGHFASGAHAPIVMIGQPNVAALRLDNPIEIPSVLSWVAYGDFSAPVRGLADFPREEWPTNVELLYYSFHVMVGLGTLFILLMAVATLQLLRRRLLASRGLLWVLMLAFPFPYIATTAGWMTTELGRQPWLLYGLYRTAEGGSPTVHGGSTLFTTLGFAGLYLVLGLLFVFLVWHEVSHGPRSLRPATDRPGPA